MITISKMTDDEIPIVSKLLCSCYNWLGEIERFPEEFTDFLITERGSVETVKRESQSQIYLVARIGETIAGMVAVRNDEITKLYVAPEHHRKGIGRELFKIAEKLIIEGGYNKVVLGAVASSPIPFYESMGMSIDERKKSRLECFRGGEIILMSKKLGQ